MAAKRGPQRSLDSIATHLLPFQRTIVSSLIPDPDAHHSEGNKLLILARGLGLTSIISTVVRPSLGSLPTVELIPGGGGS
jgi:hypothetical protein